MGYRRIITVDIFYSGEFVPWVLHSKIFGNTCFADVLFF